MTNPGLAILTYHLPTTNEQNPESKVRRDPIALAWLAAIIAAVAAYMVGPTIALTYFWALVLNVADSIDEALLRLPNLAAGLIPALAIGAIVAFIPLAILSIRAGRRGKVALVLVPSAFLWLAGRDATRMEWLEALLVAGIGALVMTGRLRTRSAIAVRN